MKDTKPKTFAFVLMPFNDDFKDVYELGIKAACKLSGAYCDRVDEQIFDENILERIYNQISKADIIISDMSTRNPNVFYETGYAHALGKRVILITNKSEDIPFDLKHYTHLIYEGSISKLKKMLITRIKWCINNPIDSLPITDIALELFIDGEPASDANMEIIGKNHEVDFDIHNFGNSVIKASSFRLGVFLNPHVMALPPSGIRQITNANGVSFYHIEPLNDLFPDSWETFTIKFINLSAKKHKGTGFIRIYSEIGTKDFNFTYELR